MRARVSPGDRTGELRKGLPVIERGHAPADAIAGLLLEPGPVDRTPIEPRRRSRLQATLRQPDCAKLLAERDRSPFAEPASRHRLLPDEQPRLEEGPSRHDESAAAEIALRCSHASHPSASDKDLERLGDDELDLLAVQQLLDSLTIQPAVGLHPWAPHSRTLAPVEHPAVDRRSVRSAGHQAVKHVELANEVALAHPPDRGVARHLTGVLGTECQQANPRPAPRCRGRRLAPGMAGADDQNVEHPASLSRATVHVKLFPRQKRE